MATFPFLRSAMMVRCPILLVLCCWVMCTSRADPCSELGIFDFSAVRGDTSPRATPVPQPRHPGVGCRDRPVQISCTDATFPSDFLCDFGGLKGHSDWENLGVISNIWMTYPLSDSSCYVELVRMEGGSKFVLRSVECFPEVPYDTVPPFRVSDIEKINLRSDRPVCWQEYFYFFAAPKTVATDGVPRVRFDLEVHKCLKTPGYPYFVSGRTTTKFQHDGRRIRPTSGTDRQ